jgi:hypothetical protein
VLRRDGRELGMDVGAIKRDLDAREQKTRRSSELVAFDSETMFTLRKRAVDFFRSWATLDWLQRGRRLVAFRERSRELGGNIEATERAFAATHPDTLFGIEQLQRQDRLAETASWAKARSVAPAALATTVVSRPRRRERKPRTAGSRPGRGGKAPPRSSPSSKGSAEDSEEDDDEVVVAALEADVVRAGGGR